MKLLSRYLLFLILLMILFTKPALAQNPANWTKAQLMEPAELSRMLQTGKHVPVIFSVGPGALIPHSIDVGMAGHQENLDRLKKELTGLPRSSKLVIYCGCCPFEHCPNVRPAISLLKEMKFTNYKLLDLSHNLKTDWIDKGYPVDHQ
jgi:thiosulfate/3-mercaptopyruvate sulfurtransferase